MTKLPEHQLLEKINKAQTTMLDPKKTSENPHFKSKFAGLDSTMDVIEPVLAENGLGHLTVFEGRDIVYTVFDLETGCILRSRLELPMDGLTGNVWQQLGQATTYMRRYLSQAFWNLVPEDDDAQSAPSRPAAQRKPQQAHRSGDEELGQASGPSNGSGVL